MIAHVTGGFGVGVSLPGAAKDDKIRVMNRKPLVAALIGWSAIAVSAQSTAPSADEIARTIAIAQKVGTKEPLTDAEKQYGFGLRVLDAHGPVITSIQGPLNRVFMDARNAVARRVNYTATDVSQAAREPVILAIAIPNNGDQLIATRGPVQVSEVVFKAFTAGAKDPKVIHAPGGCDFAPLEMKNSAGGAYQAKIAACKFPLDVFASPGARFEVAVIHDRGEWSRPLQPDELRLVK